MSGKAAEGGNFFSEWFGHRMFPHVVSTQVSLEDQRAGRCPFLTQAKGRPEECVKSNASKGVCTISSASNGSRQDWVVCPYRAFDSDLMSNIARRLFGFEAEEELALVAAPLLSETDVQQELLTRLKRQEHVLVYFDHKLGGEIQLSETPMSPQMAFDTTFVALRWIDERLVLGRFGIMEIQTMDFHGSYRSAVNKLQSALELHPSNFPEMVGANAWWLADQIEGPNIANVFKRTFYQMMFKFEIADSAACAGCVLAIPCSVWDSWQRFLGSPRLKQSDDGFLELVEDPIGFSEIAIVDEETDDSRYDYRGGPSWIYVFDFDENASTTPSPMRIRHIVSTSAQTMARHALERAPKGALTQLETALYPTLRRRIRKFWPTEIAIPDFLLR